MPTWWVGATLVVEPRFEAKQMLDRIEAEQSTAVIGVPSHYLFMLDELESRPRSIPSVRLWDYGGAAMPKEAIYKIAALFPDAEQRQQYGMTETGPSGTILLPQHTFDHIDTIGQPMPLCHIRVVDQEHRLLKRGETGNIQVKSPANMIGYYKDPEGTERVLHQGWIYTGDKGWIDAHGFLHFADRAADIINRGGLNVSSTEIEDVLYRHSDILEAAVIAIPHDKLGEDLMAVVVPRPEIILQSDVLNEFCRQYLADYKSPRHYMYVKALPKNAMGKIDKVALRKQVITGDA